jgi:hypothetical protein
VLRFACRFGSWKHHTRQLDPPVGLPPRIRVRSTEFNGQIRHRPISTIYNIYFQLAKLAAHRPRPRAAPPRHPTAMGGVHAAICRSWQKMPRTVLFCASPFSSSATAVTTYDLWMVLLKKQSGWSHFFFFGHFEQHHWTGCTVTCLRAHLPSYSSRPSTYCCAEHASCQH